MKVHPITECWRHASPDEQADLERSVREHGLWYPLLTWHGMLVDGRQRLRACEAAGVEPHFKSLDTMTEVEMCEHVFAISARRNCTPSERTAAMYAKDKLVARIKAESAAQGAAGRAAAAASRPRVNGRLASSGASRDAPLERKRMRDDTHRTSAKIAEQAGVSRCTVERLERVVEAAIS